MQNPSQRATQAAVVLLALAAFTLSSSWLGLNGRDMIFPDADHDAWDFFVRVWSDSAAADAVFVGGSVLSAVAGWMLARRVPMAYAYAACLAIGWATYAVSFSLLSEEVRPAMENGWDRFVFVGGWGWLGLNLVALAPPAAARIMEWEAWSARVDARRVGLHVALSLIFLALFALFSGGARYYQGSESLEFEPNAFQQMIATLWARGTLVLGFGGAAAVLAAFSLARRRHFLASAVVSLGFHWPLLAFASLVHAGERGAMPDVAAALRDALTTGWFGLLFAAAAPAAAAWGLEKGLRPDASEAEAAAPRAP